MGMKIFSDSIGPTPPNPQPSKFEVLKIEKRGEHQIAEVRYEGCTTFGGRKLLLMRAVEIGEVLDPHLLGEGHPVIARFEPTPDGWEMARQVAR